MEELQSFLCLRCSPKDKWILVFCGAVLDCDGPILEALAWHSMLYVHLTNANSKVEFLGKLDFMIISLNRTNLSLPTQHGYITIWDLAEGLLFVGLTVNSLEIGYQTKVILSRRSIQLNITKELLLVNDMDFTKTPQPFRPNEFVNFVETAVNTVLAFIA